MRKEELQWRGRAEQKVWDSRPARVCGRSWEDLLLARGSDHGTLKNISPSFFPESLDACWVLFQTFLIDSWSPISQDEFLADGLQVLAPISGHSGCPTTTITNSSDIGNHAFGWIISCWARFYKSRVLGEGEVQFCGVSSQQTTTITNSGDVGNHPFGCISCWGLIF